MYDEISARNACVDAIIGEDDLLFETERLRIRQLAERDIDAMFTVYGDADAMRWVDDGKPIELAECVEWVAVTRRNYETRGYGMSVMESRLDGTVIGFCGLVHPGGQVEAEIKYALHRDHWGRGLATEAVKAMIKYGRESFGLHEIIATIAPDNEASRRVVAKAGMTLRESRHEDDGTLTDVFAWRSNESS